MQAHDTVRSARLEQAEHFKATEGPISDRNIPGLKVLPEFVEALDVVLTVGTGDKIGERSTGEIENSDDTHHRETATYGLGRGLQIFLLVLRRVHEFDAGSVDGLELMPAPEMMAFDARFSVVLDFFMDLCQELIGETPSCLTIAGGIVGRRAQPRVLIPRLDQRYGIGTRLILFKNLRDPCPEHRDLREATFANVRGDLKKPLSRKNVVEESTQIGDGGTERFDALFAEDLQLTAALRSLKLRRKTGQERGKFFHTLTYP